MCDSSPSGGNEIEMQGPDSEIAKPPVSSLAIIALCCGLGAIACIILGFFSFGSSAQVVMTVVGVLCLLCPVFAVAATLRISKSGGRLRGMGLVKVSVFVFIILLLLAIIMPAIDS